MILNTANRWIILENAMSWIVVFALLAYGIGKHVQFGEEVNMNISDMSNMQLMWAFYARSKAFAITIGIFEVIAGLLIFFRKTRIIGCLFATTILVNIILQDIFYDVHKGALFAAVLYQSIIIVILLMHRDRLTKAFHALIDTGIGLELNLKFLINSILTFLLFIIFRILESYATMVFI